MGRKLSNTYQGVGAQSITKAALRGEQNYGGDNFLRSWTLDTPAR